MKLPKGPGDERLKPPQRGRPKVGRDNGSVQRVAELYFCDRLSVRKIASVMGLSHMTVYRMLNEIDLHSIGM